MTEDTVSDREPVARPGDILLGKYQVERTIGEGGMGVVLAVRHMDLGELFAMKVLKRSALRVTRGAERFSREARAVARLRSEHVAHVYDVGLLENGLPYMLLEHLEGRDLGTLLEEEGSLSAREAVDCVLLALDAVIEAHDQGIVHRDLKPENLFLAARNDGTLTIKVLDFGISKDLRAETGGSVTHTSNVLGSPFYMSPEQMRSAKHVDERTDLWALGIILFELLTSEVPFPGETLTQVCANVIERPLPDVSDAAPGTPASVIAIVEKSLARNIQDRFQSARELAEALRRVGHDLEDVPSGIKLDRVRRLFRRTPRDDSSPARRVRSTAYAVTLSPEAPTPESPPETAYVLPPAASGRKGSSFAVAASALALSLLGVLAVRADRNGHQSGSPAAVASATGNPVLHPTSTVSSPASVESARTITAMVTPNKKSEEPRPKEPVKASPPRAQAKPSATEVKPPKKYEGIY